jgi:hypothetical protein
VDDQRPPDHSTMNESISLSEYRLALEKHGTRALAGSDETLWIRHESIGMERLPVFSTTEPASQELRRVCFKAPAVVLSYLRDPSELRPANAWSYLCRNTSYQLGALSPSMRRNVQRGLNSLTIRQMSGEELLAHAIAVYCDSRRKAGLSDGTPEGFLRRFSSQAGCPGHIFWGAWLGSTLAAFLSIREVENWAEIEGGFSLQDLLIHRPNDAMFYTVLSHYLVERGFSTVSYGLSSIQPGSNAPGLHDFKIKVGFEAVPVRRVFALNPILKPLAGRAALKGLRITSAWFPRSRALKKAEGVLTNGVDEAG